VDVLPHGQRATRSRHPRLLGLAVRSVFAGVAVLLSLLLTSCGAGATEPGTPSSASPTPGAPPTHPADSPSPSTVAALTIDYDDGGGTVSTWKLTCDPDGGDHPDPAAACAALARNGATALPAVGPGKMCTQVFGGPQTALVTGTWRGQEWNSRLNRADGCQTARWDALEGLLPRVSR
jgi:hypothetical protein